jgi:hypothetical protein
MIRVKLLKGSSKLTLRVKQLKGNSQQMLESELLNVEFELGHSLKG